MITRKEEQILLTIIHLENKAYLVNVREKLKEIIGRYLDVGSINKTLKKLERDGYLEGILGQSTPVRGGKAIKYYSLTEKAFEALWEVKTIQNKLWEKAVLPGKNK
jgi:DNA-binding PadR family transcriptional regulator